MNRFIPILATLGTAAALVAGPAAARRADCAAIGTWPGPNGPHFLNQFNDGKCGVLVRPATFPDAKAGTPADLELDSGTWTVQESVEFDPGSTVTVDPGATLAFDYLNNHSSPNAYVFVSGGTMTFDAGSGTTSSSPNSGIVVDEHLDSGEFGTLQVDGTAQSPVTMSGSGPGSWGGLRINEGTTAAIDGLVLTGAGAPTQPYATSPSTGIYILNDSPTISDTTVSDSGGNGVEVDRRGAGTAAPTFDDLTLSGNAGYPLQYDFLTPDLTRISRLHLSGNGHDGVRLANATAAGYASDVTWPNLRYPIVDDIVTTVDGGAHLTIAPGTTVQFGAGDGLSVAGTLTADAAGKQAIRFTSDRAVPAPGDWTGVSFADHGTGSLANVHVSFAGGSSAPAAVQVANATPTLSDVTVDHSATNGIEVSRGGQPLLLHTTLADNGGYPLRYDSLPLDLGSFTSFSASHNAQNAVDLETGGTYTSAVSWPNLGVPYRISGTGIGVQGGGSLTVAAGDTVEFAKNVGNGDLLQAGNGGTLTMQGTAANPIRLTSAEAAPARGDWAGVLLLGGSTSALRDVRITDAGGPTGFTPAASVYVKSTAATITNTTIGSSLGDDVDVAGGAKPRLVYDSFLAVPAGSSGVANEGWSTGQPLLAAIRNWWGANGGPASGTPAGPGVRFSPWLSFRVSPASGGRGTTATVSGTGFKPGETVTVYWGCRAAPCTGATALATPAADADGSFSTQITIPAGAALGADRVGALGGDSGAFLGTGYTVTP